jgi:two-component sensor histidine kinase
VIQKSATVVDYEMNHELPGVGRRTILLSARQLFQSDDNNTTMLVSIQDVTESRQMEEEKDLLLGELRHRMKNLLAMVQALVLQTQAEGRSGEEYREALLGRLRALVQAHDLAFSAKDGTELHELVQRTLEPYGCEPTAVVLEGGSRVVLAPKQVLSVNLVLHELATNAVKHGALSIPGGRVRVRWEVETRDGGRLRLRWQESGGPPVNPPASRGFGTRLIEFATTRDLGGRAELRFAPEGLEAEIVVRLVSGERVTVLESIE